MINLVEYEIFKEKFIFHFKEHELQHDEKILNNFYTFTNYLLSENQKYNLTSITDIDEIIVKHYIDSVIILKYISIPENSKIIDLGTGAGFPGIPLLIMRGDLKITFLDSSNKKINFIKNVLPQISENNRISEPIFYCGRAEELGKNLDIRETYDFAVSRAVSKLNILCELTAPFIHTGGFFISYKSKNLRDEIQEGKNALKILNMEIEETAEFQLKITTGEIGRTIIKIKKSQKTSSKYPRKFSEITKNPL